MNDLTKKISEYDKIAASNAVYVSKYQKIAEQYGREWLKINRLDVPSNLFNFDSIDLLSKDNDKMRQYISSKVPQNIAEGYNIYLNNQGEALRLAKQKSDLWNSVQEPIKQQFINSAVINRKIASIGSVIMGLASLTWLILLYILGTKRKVIVNED